MKVISVTQCNYNYNGMVEILDTILLNPNFIISVENIEYFGGKDNLTKLSQPISKIIVSKGMQTNTLFCIESLEKIEALINH